MQGKLSFSTLLTANDSIICLLHHSTMVQTGTEVKCCKTFQHVCNICSVWLDSINTSIMSRCTQRVSLQRYCTASSTGLALDV